MAKSQTLYKKKKIKHRQWPHRRRQFLFITQAHWSEKGDELVSFLWRAASKDVGAGGRWQVASGWEKWPSTTGRASTESVS